MSSVERKPARVHVVEFGPRLVRVPQRGARASPVVSLDALFAQSRSPVGRRLAVGPLAGRM